MIGPKSLLCCALIACTFELYAANCPSLLQHAADAARAAVPDSYDIVRSQKAQREAPPDNPETRYTYNSSTGRGGAGNLGGAAASEKNGAPKHIQEALPPPLRSTRQCKQHEHIASWCCCCSMICCYCGNEITPPPNEGRAIRTIVKSRGISTQGGTCTCWLREWLILGTLMSILHAATNQVDFNTFDSSGHHGFDYPIFTARLSL